MTSGYSKNHICATPGCRHYIMRDIRTGKIEHSKRNPDGTLTRGKKCQFCKCRTPKLQEIPMGRLML